MPFLLLLGCSSHLVQRVEFDSQTYTAGTTFAPAAPHAVGPLLAPGQVALEGSVSVGARQAPVRSREGGALGGWVLRDAAHARLAWAWMRGLEGGFVVDAAHASLAGPLATNVAPHPEAQVLLRLGQQLRFGGEVAPRVQAGGLLEAELGALRYYRTERLTTTVSTLEQERDGREVWDTQVDTDERFTDEMIAAVSGRAGVFLGWDTPWGPSVGGGGAIQLVPTFPGYVHQSWSCTFYDDGDSYCGDKPEEPPTLVYGWSLTPWLDVTVPAGPVAIVGRGWIQATGWELSSPGGVEVGVRWVPKREGSALR